jgi:hypothetical protein
MVWPMQFVEGKIFHPWDVVVLQLQTAANLRTVVAVLVPMWLRVYVDQGIFLLLP